MILSEILFERKTKVCKTGNFALIKNIYFFKITV